MIDTRPWTDPVRRDRMLIAMAYVLAWGAMLVNRGFYWDDWTLVGLSPADLIHQFQELGMPWAGAFYAVLFAAPLPGLVGHVLVFFAYLLSALLVHAILRRIPGVRSFDALVAGLTVAVLPVNYARIAVIDLPYGLSLLAFLGATWLLVRSIGGGRSRARHLGALVLYLASFFTASLLVLYVVPMALIAVLAWRSEPRGFRSFAIGHVDFIALPVAYWVVKSVWFKPTGVYEGYNALTVHGLAGVPAALPAIPGQVLIEPMVRAVTMAGLIGVGAGAILAMWLIHRTRVPEPYRSLGRGALALAAIGLVVLGLGVFAYLAVGRIPTLWDWSSRHQLLVPLGAGLLAAAAVRGAQSVGRLGSMVGVVVFGVLVGSAAVVDARTLVAYQADWFKQTALMEAATSIPELRGARHIRIVDAARSFDTLRRRYRFYEYNALLSQALGGTGRLASDGTTEPPPDRLDAYVSRPAYHMGDYVPSPIDLELRISSRGYPGVAEILRLVGLEAIGSPSFAPEVSRLIDVRASAPAGPAGGRPATGAVDP